MSPHSTPDPLAEFPPEERHSLVVVETPPPTASREDVRPDPPVAAQQAGRVGTVLRGWLRPFWLGCAVGALVAGWFASGRSEVTAPAEAAPVVPDLRRAHDVRLDARDRPPSPWTPPPAWSTEPEAVVPPPPEAAAAPAARATTMPSARPEPLRFVGSLAVDSTPVRARVFINGEPAGLTPVVMSSLAVGSRAIRLEADDHMPWSTVVQVVAGRETSVRATLPQAHPETVSQSP